MSSPYYVGLSGHFVIEGKEPDGDSVAFRADEPDLFEEVQNGHLIKPRSDGTVQLRMEGIDATELHYNGADQALAMEARDRLIHDLLGFTTIDYEPGNLDRVARSQPAAVPGLILTKGCDVHGRPISYLLLEEHPRDVAMGDWTYVDEHLIQRTLNYQLLADGTAYYTVYNTTPRRHRRVLQSAAIGAHEMNRGVWALDSARRFALHGQHSIGPRGDLILPKLFRRCTDYLKSIDSGAFNGTLMDWLELPPHRGQPGENDLVIIDGHTQVPLSVLLQQRNAVIVFQPNILDIVFVVK